MEKYSYKAINTDGKTIKGKLIASSPDELKAMITKNGLYCVSYNVEIDLKNRAKKMPVKSLITFCNQLASMLKAGLSIVNAVEMLYSRVEDAAVKKALGRMYESVQKGNSLSDAIFEMGETFPIIMYNMIRAGELSGELDHTLRKLAAHFESENRLNNQIKGAMSYPMMLGGVGFAVVILMITYVLPMMAGSMADKMSPSALKLIGMGDWIKANWYIVIGVIVIVVIVVKTLKRSPEVKFKWDQLKINIPKLGPLIRMVYTSRFARNLATLYDNGIELIEAMTMCTKLIGNVFLEGKLMASVEKVKKGEAISTALGSLNVFDPLLISMIYVGEESGVLGEVLNQTADYFDEQSSYAIKKIVGMINPIMILILAGAIGYVMVLCMGPLLSMYEGVDIDEIVRNIPVGACWLTRLLGL